MQAMYVDHTKCCATPNAIVQRAPLPFALFGQHLDFAVFVDGGLIEAFAGGRVSETRVDNKRLCDVLHRASIMGMLCVLTPNTSCRTWLPVVFVAAWEIRF